MKDAIKKEKSPFICKKCEGDVEYSSCYDAYHCAKCNSWNEDKCKDPGCGFCMCRPDKPNDSNLDSHQDS